MTRLVIELGDIEISERAQAALLSDLQRSALTYLSQLRLEDALLSFSFPKTLWALMLHGASRGYWNLEDYSPRR